MKLPKCIPVMEPEPGMWVLRHVYHLLHLGTTPRVGDTASSWNTPVTQCLSFSSTTGNQGTGPTFRGFCWVFSGCIQVMLAIWMPFILGTSKNLSSKSSFDNDFPLVPKHSEAMQAKPLLTCLLHELLWSSHSAWKNNFRPCFINRRPCLTTACNPTAHLCRKSWH